MQRDSACMQYNVAVRFTSDRPPDHNGSTPVICPHACTHLTRCNTSEHALVVHLARHSQSLEDSHHTSILCSCVLQSQAKSSASVTSVEEHCSTQYRTILHDFGQLATITHKYAQLHTITHNYTQFHSIPHDVSQFPQ